MTALLEKLNELEKEIEECKELTAKITGKETEELNGENRKRG